MNKSKFSSKVIASILSLMMVISIFPLSGNVYAATAEHPDAVTITVVDDKGQPIKDASVVFVVDSVANGDAYISETKKTDETGVVEVMVSDAFVAVDLTISATVTADGYEGGELPETAIESSDANFDVTLKDITIRDVDITPKTLTYNGKAQELVSVTEVEGDTVEYYYPSDSATPSNKVPEETNAGEYNVRVVVKREGKNNLDETVTAKINKAEITDISIKEKTISYNEEEQELVVLSGSFDENDKVTWIVNGEELVSKEIPTAIAVYTYNITLKVQRDNYVDFEQSVTTKLIEGELKLDGLTVKGLDGVYTVEDGNPVAQPAVTVKNKGNYDLKYQLDDGDLAVNDDAWVDEIPTVTDAGSYIVWVKAIKDNYNDKDVDVEAAESAVAPYNVVIKKAAQTLSFVNTLPTSVVVSTNEEENVYDFSVDGENLSGEDIEYSLIDTTSSDVAAISDDGKVTVFKAGMVTIKATRKGNKNYDDISIHATLIVKVSSNGLVNFLSDKVDYILDEAGVVSKETAQKLNSDDNGKLTYSIDKNNVGLSINGTNGEVTVGDRRKLYKEMGKAGYVVATVTVNKSAGTVTSKAWYDPFGILGTETTEEVYPASFDTYTIMITYDIVADVETLFKMAAPDPVSGWYNKNYPATIIPVDSSKYKIALDEPTNFEDSVTIEEQGVESHYVFLKDTATKRITAGVKVEQKIDTIAPDTSKMRIEIQELSIVEKMGVNFGFYNPDVNIKFIVEDELEDNESGMDYIEWFYSKEENATSSILATDTGKLPVVKEGYKYVANLTLTASEANQFRGHISFKAYDKANNVSNEVKDNGVVIVVDTINPEMRVEFNHVDAAGEYNKLETSTGVYQHYFNGDVNFKFTVKESNFFPKEDVEVKVVKDGGKPTDLDLTWTSNDEIHSAEFTLSGDGDYVVTMKYKDSSGNKMIKDDEEIEVYTSEVITIDTIAAKVTQTFDKMNHKLTLEVTERYFRTEDIVFDGKSIVDINGNPISNSVGQIAKYYQALLNEENWKTEGIVHTFVFDDFEDGFYNWGFGYKDIANNNVENEYIEFIVDETIPTTPVIEYAKSPIDEFIETITLGFYNPSVTVRFTAYDVTTGVKSFTWGYTKEATASTINHPSFLSEETIDAVQDSTDKSKFTAMTTLTADEYNQYRGYLSVSAIDGYVDEAFKNVSEKVDDNNNIIVVDTIAPELKIEYSPAANDKDSNEHFYNDDIFVTITATEANFCGDDVKVTVTKNGEVFDFGDVAWGTRDTEDKTIGTFTLPAPVDHSGDGHYIVNVEYTDKSGNFDEEKSAYTSHTLTIDTTAPVINVEYQNTEVKNTLKDSDDKDRDYFDKTQTAVVTIEEHNFASKEVEFSIVAKDVTGAELDATSLHNKSEWTVDSTGDIHTITITYDGDANYTFDVAYIDKATNAAEDYAEDYFTVDKTAPDLGVVVYDPEFKEVVLNAITFGFYKEKVTVTLTATDNISEVYSFLYSYLNADGVSSVNAELIKQVIEAADIKYSENRDIATTTFEIPKAALGDDNQFNGTVEFTATDRAGNESVTHKEKNRVVVDNIVPTAKVIYSEAINTEGKISYYDGDIDVTIKVTEANFYSKDVKVKVSKDGKETNISKDVKWKDNSVDEHTGTFTLTEDGDYNVLIDYTDKSGNVMKSYKSDQLTIDTDIKAPTLSINGVGHTGDSGAYNKDVTISYSFEDVNYDTSNIRLTRTKFDTVEDVTSEFVGTNITADGGSGSFQIPSKVANDGIYTLTVNMADKANHTTESRMTFTVNRYGSVYVYDNYLASLIKDGGQFITIKGDNKVAITEDLIINEYNACELKKDSLKILITRDGEVVDADYTWKQVNGNSGWYQYAYTIDAENFKEDGVYKISLSSKYNTVDSEDNESTSVPENSFKTNGEEILDTMSFVVDTKAPEIRNVINLDKKVADKDAIKDGKLTVKYTVIDIGGLKSIQIIVNGEKLDEITKFGDDQYNYSGEFVLNADSDEQTVQIIVTDKAGNVTDTSSKEFTTGDVYVFNGELTVPSSFIDRVLANIRVFFESWYANKPLFWGSIAGVVVFAGGIWFIVLAKKKKKDEEE